MGSAVNCFFRTLFFLICMFIFTRNYLQGNCSCSFSCVHFEFAPNKEFNFKMTLLIGSVCVYKNAKVQYFLCTVSYAVHISPCTYSLVCCIVTGLLSVRDSKRISYCLLRTHRKTDVSLLLPRITSRRCKGEWRCSITVCYSRYQMKVVER